MSEAEPRRSRPAPALAPARSAAEPRRKYWPWILSAGLATAAALAWLSGRQSRPAAPLAAALPPAAAAERAVEPPPAPAPAAPVPAAAPMDSTRLLQAEPRPAAEQWSRADLDGGTQAELAALRAPAQAPAPQAPAAPVAPPAGGRPFNPPRLQRSGLGGQREAVFEEPSVKRGARTYRLDWCASWEQNCGAGAAAEFCRLNGFSGVRSFEPDGKLNLRGIETAIITEAATFCPGTSPGHQCDGFKRIVCENGSEASQPRLRR